MANQELSSLAVVSPVLSRLAVGVAGTQNYMADQAIPVIPVDQETVTWPTFTNEQLVDDGSSDVRALDADPQEDLLDSIGKDSSTLDEHMRAGKIDQRRINAAQASQGGPAVKRLQLRYIQKVKNKILIGKEKVIAALVDGTTGSFGGNSAAGGDWSASATKVRDLVFSKMELIEKATGYRPNRFKLGRKVRRSLLQNPDIFAGRQYSKGGFVSDDDLASFFELAPGQLYVPTAVTQTKAAAGKAGTPTSIWIDDTASLYYVDPATEDQASDLNPSFAYTMQLTYPETGTREKVQTWLDGLFTRFVYGQTYSTKVTFGGTNGAGFRFTGITGAQ